MFCNHQHLIRINSFAFNSYLILILAPMPYFFILNLTYTVYTYCELDSSLRKAVWNPGSNHSFCESSLVTFWKNTSPNLEKNKQQWKTTWNYVWGPGEKLYRKKCQQYYCPFQKLLQVQQFFFFLIIIVLVFWYFFCLCRPSEANLQLSCQQGTDMSLQAGEKLDSNLGLHVLQSGALPLSHHIPPSLLSCTKRKNLCSLFFLATWLHSI